MDLTGVPLQSTSYQTLSFLLFVIHDKPFVFKYLSLYLLTSGLILLYFYLSLLCVKDHHPGILQLNIFPPAQFEPQPTTPGLLSLLGDHGILS